MYEDVQHAVHEALQGYLDDGELAICWTLTIDVAGTDGRRYLAHRAGGGADGTDNPQAWSALGMLQASADVARHQLAGGWTRDADEDDDPPPT